MAIWAELVNDSSYLFENMLPYARWVSAAIAWLLMTIAPDSLVSQDSEPSMPVHS
jgi:hypothetical protein